MSVLHGGTLQIESGFFFFLFLLLFFLLNLLFFRAHSGPQSNLTTDAETHSKERGLGCVLSIFQTNLFDPKAPQIAFSISGCTATSQIKSPVGKPCSKYMSRSSRSSRPTHLGSPITKTLRQYNSHSFHVFSRV